MRHTMHLQPNVAKQPNLELKTWPKQLLGSLPLVIVFPGEAYSIGLTVPDACIIKLIIKSLA